MATPARVWGVWNVAVHGPNIHLGKDVIIAANNKSETNLTTLKIGKKAGSIKIGNHVKIMNGVRISSATQIIIKDNCLLASFCYLTDADWHDVYNRGQTPGKTAPIILEKNVWIGDSAIICKGVRIGENSIVGAGSVVTKDVPANVIVAGKPAKKVKELEETNNY